MGTNGTRRGRLEAPHLERRHEIVRRFALNGWGRCSLCDAIVREDSVGCPGPPVTVDGMAPPKPVPTSPEQLAYVRWEASLAGRRVPQS